MATVPRPSLDSVTTIRDDGSRFFLHPADVRGRFTTARRLAAAVLIAVYVLLPWIPINGYPAVFLDVANRRFHLFGLTLAAQDLFLLMFLVSGVGFSLFLVTALLGRIWCGWACPQTVFLEHVFRVIERWIEGDAAKRRALDNAPWDTAKAVKRIAKHALFILCAALIAHIFLAYFVSLPRLYGMVTHAPTEHWAAFVFMFVFTAVLYGNFAWFREQLCIIICPYGRFQSALIDDNSMVIGYDAQRGEPRGRRTGAKAANLGDCVDCNRCVAVCPTGIDIRQGLQMECIGCAACIDACDEVMTKVKLPRGLIRYDSQQGLARKPTRIFRPRILVYLVLLLCGAGAFTYAASRIQPAVVTVFRMQGLPFFVDEAGIRNQFVIHVINKTTEPVSYAVTADAGRPDVALAVAALRVEPNAETSTPLVLSVPRAGWTGRFPVTVTVRSEDGSAEIVRTVEFLGPDPRLLRDEASPRP